jgi:hypothetical protein
MSKMPHMASTTSEDLVVPVEPAAAGSIPTLLKCHDEAGEISEVQGAARDQSAAGTVGILARTWPEAFRAVAGLNGARKLKENSKEPWDPAPGVYYGTYHSAKGLEACDDFVGAARLVAERRELVLGLGHR